MDLWVRFSETVAAAIAAIYFEMFGPLIKGHVLQQVAVLFEAFFDGDPEWH